VFKNAVYEGAAGVPDVLLNAPNRVLNLGKAAVGTAATALGKPDLAQDLKPDPDFARRAFESAGLIKPGVKPTGAIQKAIDLLTQGAVGGAMTGGASIPRTLAGAGMGALSTGASGATEAMTGNRELGIAAGLAAPAAAGRALGGGRPLRKDVELLNKEGVQMTAGQIAGGTAKRIEDAATSIPVLGDAIKSAQRRGIDSFGEAAMNRALAPIGEKLPKGMKGNEAIGYVQDKLGDAYDALLPKLKGNLYGAGGTSFYGELQTIKQMGQNLPPEQRGQLDRIIQHDVIDRFTNAGLASGESIKGIESQLGGMASTMGRSENRDVRALGSAVKEVQSALRGMIVRENPQYKGELSKINEGYANFKRTQVAASSVGAKDGAFTPAQLHNAAKAKDTSKDKSKFARGEALMQDLTGAGKNVLASSVPDSGTATRALVAGVGAGGAGYIFDHPVAVGGALLTTLPYTPWGQRAMQAMMIGAQRQNVKEAAKRSVIPLSVSQDDVNRAGIGQ
jgi:hypothetical protein